jgi:hypothetical protein
MFSIPTFIVSFGFHPCKIKSFIFIHTQYFLLFLVPNRQNLDIFKNIIWTYI